MDQPQTKVEIREWPGLITNTDRHEVPPGAGQVQVNAQSKTPGELEVRKGLKLVTFE